MLLKTLAVRQLQSRKCKRTRIATFTGSAIRTPRTVDVLHAHCDRPRRLAARLVAHNRLCSATPPPPSASASRPSRTPRCPQIVSLGGANHRPWMRRGRRHQCAHATLHGLALRRGFSARNRTGHHRVRSRGMRFLSPREIPDSRGFGQPRLPTLVCSRPPVPRSPRDAAKSAVPWLARRRCVTTPSLPTTVR